MAVIDQLASLLLTAERASADGTVTIDVFLRNETGRADGGLVPMWADQSPIGRIVAENERICWVMAKGSDTTVSDLLAAETGIPRKQLEDVYQAAQTDGSPFCETLAAAGLVSAEEVRQTLRRHTAAAAVALAHMGSDDETIVSVARIPSAAYDTEFTHDALMVLAAAGNESDEFRAKLGNPPDSFVTLAPKVEAALCMRESDHSELSLVPIAAHGNAGIRLTDALELGLQALDATAPSDPVLAEIDPFPLIMRGESEWWLCHYSAPHVCLYQLNGRRDYLDALEALVQASRAADA